MIHKKNIYLYCETDGRQYKLYKAIDDGGNLFEYSMPLQDKEAYLKSLIEFNGCFEEYCTEGKGREIYCTVWTKEYKDINWSEQYGEHDFDYFARLAENDPTAMMTLSGNIALRDIGKEYEAFCCHLEDSISFEEFAKSVSPDADEPYSTRNVVRAYIGKILKSDFTQAEKRRMYERAVLLLPKYFSSMISPCGNDYIARKIIEVALERLKNCDRELYGKLVGELLFYRKRALENIDKAIYFTCYNILENVMIEKSMDILDNCNITQLKEFDDIGENEDNEELKEICKRVENKFSNGS